MVGAQIHLDYNGCYGIPDIGVHINRIGPAGYPVPVESSFDIIVN